MAFRRTWSSYGPPYPFGRWSSYHHNFSREWVSMPNDLHIGVSPVVVDRRCLTATPSPNAHMPCRITATRHFTAWQSKTPSSPNTHDASPRQATLNSPFDSSEGNYRIVKAGGHTKQPGYHKTGTCYDDEVAVAGYHRWSNTCMHITR